MLRSRRATHRFAGLAVAGLASCSSGDQFRGTDRSAVLPAARARWAWRPAPPPASADHVRYRPMLEAGASYVQGEFTQASTGVDYEVWTGHVAFSPELSWHHVRVNPLVGLGYGTIEVESGSARAREANLGVALGIEAGWQGWSFVEPYVRYTGAYSVEWRVGRFEAGVELRASATVGFQLAYARQTNIIDQTIYLSGIDQARIETEGVHLGLSLRF